MTANGKGRRTVHQLADNYLRELERAGWTVCVETYAASNNQRASYRITFVHELSSTTATRFIPNWDNLSTAISDFGNETLSALPVQEFKR